MFKLFDKKPVLDETAIQWMFDCYEWAFRNLDAKLFFESTTLVYPNNDYFPGQENSPEAKSNLILDQVRQHAGMKNWPVRLVDEDTYLASSFVNTAPKLTIEGSARGATALQPVLNAQEDALFIVYQPNLLRNPQALIANYAQMLANYLGYTVVDPPPGGIENWPMLTEMIAIFMGFGLMYANTAGNVRISSCGSCQGPSAERVNYLSQYDAAYALAIFAALKNIDTKEIKPYLKKTLHTFYRKALAEVESRDDEMSRLRKFAI
jgi:hypothetical protein